MDLIKGEGVWGVKNTADGITAIANSHMSFAKEFHSVTNFIMKLLNKMMIEKLFFPNKPVKVDSCLKINDQAKGK